MNARLRATGEYADIMLTEAVPTCVVGRSRNADYHVTHPDLSGLHCTFSLDLAHHRLLLTDTSTNGTYVDGHLVGKGQARELAHSSRINFLAPERDVDVPVFTICIQLPTMKHSAPPPPASSSPQLSAVLMTGTRTWADCPRRRLRRLRSRDVDADVPSLEKLSQELLTLILASLDTRSALALTSCSSRLRLSLDVVELRRLKKPLRPAQVVRLVERFPTLRRLTLADGCLSPRPDDAAGCCDAISRLVGQLDKLDLSRNQLFASGSKTLSTAFSAFTPLPTGPSIRSPTHARPLPLTHLSLRDAGLCVISMPGAMAHDQESAVLLLQSLRAASQLVSLDLGGNKLSGKTAGEAIGGVISSLHELRELLLERNMLGNEGVIALANEARAHPSLARLCVDENFIGESGAKALAKLLSKSSSLTSLSVGWNGLERTDALDLSRAAVNNDRMVELGLSCNTCLLERSFRASDLIENQICRAGLKIHAMAL